MYQPYLLPEVVDMQYDKEHEVQWEDQLHLGSSNCQYSFKGKEKKNGMSLYYKEELYKYIAHLVFKFCIYLP